MINPFNYSINKQSIFTYNKLNLTFEFYCAVCFFITANNVPYIIIDYAYTHTHTLLWNLKPSISICAQTILLNYETKSKNIYSYKVLYAIYQNKITTYKNQ